MDDNLELRGDEPVRGNDEDTHGFGASQSSSEELPFHIPRD